MRGFQWRAFVSSPITQCRFRLCGGNVLFGGTCDLHAGTGQDRRCADWESGLGGEDRSHVSGLSAGPLAFYAPTLCCNRGLPGAFDFLRRPRSGFEQCFDGGLVVVGSVGPGVYCAMVSPTHWSAAELGVRAFEGWVVL